MSITRDEFDAEIRKLRIRFWGIMIAVIVGSAIGVYQIQTTQSDDAARALALQQRLGQQQRDFQRDSVRRCHQGNHRAGGTRDVFTEILKLSARGAHPPSQQARINRFLRASHRIIFTKIPPIPCGEAPPR